MSNRPYEIIDSESHNIGRFKIVKDTISLNGEKKEYSYFISHDSVCVLALFEGKVLVINQYRHALDEWLLELPCGCIEEGESAVEAAKRELQEETGYVAEEFIPLGTYYTSQGLSRDCCSVFFANCIGKEERNLDALEMINVQEMRIEDFDILVKENKFRLLVGLAAWNKAKELKLIQVEGEL